MTIGKLLEFNVRSGNWTMYVERAEMYFKVNEIKEDLWLPTLIAAMGDEAYELLSNLTSPAKPSDKTYAFVTKVMKEHLQPKPSFMAERYRFRQRRQEPGESISQYISELKKMARFCDFKAVLEENLRDQLVCGLSSETIRQRVFTEEDLGYDKAVKIACAMEAAERDAAAVERAEPTSGGARVGDQEILHAGVVRRGRGASVRGGARPQRSRGPNPGGSGGGSSGGYKLDPCAACGGFDHQADDCQYNKYICGKCRQRGHLRRVCPERASGAQARRTGSGGGRLLATVEAGDPEEMRRGLDLSEDDESPPEDEEEIEEDLYQLCLNGYKPV